ncbi:formylglycine-generating enzyme family protein [Thalassomonas actiniarum]|uniref:SUMF1/EgtB/PvdO family nonheme iron enzyme n=1 Tax=Thalassomonas actiniarum TaxID=485447 RepID=A0AAE9YUI8_9GAMM|nr:SUMF1/EgtB/PvdO family nonheme iron enzyme [Thalassomonas actiniarum]WDE00832.1 SUMF1/EgtB/PvdO family nonheme iron enzyme [Thalassomonas actiniarum]
MKQLPPKLFAPLLLLASTAVNADTAPIEPVLVPLKNAADKIDIQMGKYEVTVAEFSRFIKATGYQVPQKCMLFSSSKWPSPENPGKWDEPELISDPYRPVVCVGTLGAMAYTEWLAKTTGKPYRLAELNEWRYAASEGKKSRFAFGEDYHQKQICDYENVEDYANVAGLKRDHQVRYDSSANCNDGAVYHTVVGMYRANKFGLHDMMGNVKELLQTCLKNDEKAPGGCAEYAVAGEAWHWQARGVNNPDWIAADFYGSIEGFRLVLDSKETQAQSASTASFIKDLAKAQQKAQKSHQRLKSLPLSPTGLTANLLKNNQVELNWLPVTGNDISYSIYRSYLDPEGKVSRKPQKIAEGVKQASFIDQLTGKGPASYTVFANSSAGESMASNEASAGVHKAFKPGERIQAEHYQAKRHTWVRDNKQEQSVGLSDNENHYATGQKPFLPAWLKFNFNSDYTGQGTLKMRLRSQDGASFEIWQGHHLVARLTGGKSDAFSEITADVSLIASQQPLEIRAANQSWLLIDWFEFSL